MRGGIVRSVFIVFVVVILVNVLIWFLEIVKEVC